MRSENLNNSTHWRQKRNVQGLPKKVSFLHAHHEKSNELLSIEYLKRIQGGSEIALKIISLSILWEDLFKKKKLHENHQIMHCSDKQSEKMP